MVEYLLYSVARGLSDIIFTPFMWLFTSTSVPLSIVFCLAMLGCIAFVMARWKFGAHKWFGRPVIKVTKLAVPALFILAIYIAGSFKDGDIALTDDQSAHVQLSGEFIITGVLDGRLGSGFNISLTPIAVMQDTSITDKYLYTKTTHWEEWQSARVKIAPGEIVTVAIINRDLRLFPQLEKRPVPVDENTDEGGSFFGSLFGGGSDKQSAP